jgi:hypothetical protein
MLRDNLMAPFEPMYNSVGFDPLALGIQKQVPYDRPACLENPRQKAAESLLTGRVPSSSQAESGQDYNHFHCKTNRGEFSND